MEEKFYTPEELEEILNKIKSFLDKTYLDIKYSRYGQKQANRAMLEFFMSGDYGSFPGEETRKKFEEFQYHYDEMYQVLLDFAISSYIADRRTRVPTTVSSLKEIHEYATDRDGVLDYSKEKVIEVVALSTAENTYNATNVIACNPKLKKALIMAFIEERYNTSNERKQQLDASKSAIVKLQEQALTMSKSHLNRDIDNMIRDNANGIGHFDPNDLVVIKSIENGPMTR